MADSSDMNMNNMDIRVLKRTKISVFVDEALPDILVVTYEFGVKIFKGVLLDSTKKNLPCGVEALNPALNTKPNPDDDTLYSANQRFAYTNPENPRKKHVGLANGKQKNNKMTVRLRPRQVLCSKCKGICNENSENVGRKRKVSESLAPPPKRAANAPVTRSANASLEAMNRRSLTNANKLASDVSSALTGNTNKINIDNNPKKPLLTVSNLNTTLRSNRRQMQMEVRTAVVAVETSDCDTETSSRATRTKTKRVLRKRKEEDAYEDNSEENSNKSSGETGSNTCSSTRTIKISYGPQGEGTVLKIPAQIDPLNVSDESEENVDTENAKSKLKDSNNDKAARRALKKAKKEARRKFLLSGNNSPRYSLGGSPRYSMGDGVTTRLGNNSPRYVAAFDLNVPRRRKHKMKHKKKHRDDRKHKDDDINLQSLEEAAREQCITQKLSINLKRLNNTYTSNNFDKIEDSSSDEQCEQVPDFPIANPPLMLRVNAKSVANAFDAGGVRLLVGDVVWGKMPGFPWWPGKVLAITKLENEAPEAHVAWYGYTTSSLMKCDQLCLYLENFKTRYNKKKRGAYKEAIRQAMTDARENAENRIRDAVVGSPVHSLINVAPPALASPREIDVVS